MSGLNLPITNHYNPKIEYSKKFRLRRIKDINVYLTYINHENEIEIISKKKLYIENKQNTITRTQLVDIIKNCQRKSNISYKLISIMVYNVNVTPETLSDYIENPEEFITLFTLSRIDSFELQSTISLLQEFNAMYFFFLEVPSLPALPALPALPPPSPSPSPSLSPALLESREKGEKGEKHIENIITSQPKPHNTTKRIFINNKTNPRVNNRNNKTKRYDKYVNLL